MCAPLCLALRAAHSAEARGDENLASQIRAAEKLAAGVEHRQHRPVHDALRADVPDIGVGIRRLGSYVYSTPNMNFAVLI